MDYIKINDIVEKLDIDTSDTSKVVAELNKIDSHKVDCLSMSVDRSYETVEKRYIAVNEEFKKRDPNEFNNHIKELDKLLNLLDGKNEDGTQGFLSICSYSFNVRVSVSPEDRAYNRQSLYKCKKSIKEKYDLMKKILDLKCYVELEKMDCFTYKYN